MVSVSKFRHVIRFENPTKTANTSGGRDEAYADFLTTRGSVEKRDGFRNFSDGYDAIINTYVLHTYWRGDLEANLTRDTRVIYDNRSFRIETWERVNEERSFMKFTISEIR